LNIFKKSAVTSVVFLAVMSGNFLLHGQNAISLNREGWDHYKRAEYQRALLSFTSSLRLNPDYTDSLIGAGRSHYALSSYDMAMEMFSAALRQDEKSADALTGMGMVLSDVGRFSEAISYFDRAYAVSGESIEPEYGLAYAYYRMGKRLWAVRKLENIFRINPYHFESLLLMADIKTDELRLKEARSYVEKAIDTNRESPVGHIRYGSLLLKNFMLTGDSSSLAEAKESYDRALSINPDSFRANMDMGLISLVEQEHLLHKQTLSGNNVLENDIKASSGAAVEYFSRAVSAVKNRSSLYSMALAWIMGGDRQKALEYMLEAYSGYPSDSVLKASLEDFLVFNEYKTGHPARVMLGRENSELASYYMRESLHGSVIYYLRRSLLLNPFDRAVREELIRYYSILNYNRLYIDEIKQLLSQYPDNKIQDMLNVAIIKRRDRLYHREGYSAEPVPRNVPSILVLNFNSAGKIIEHPDAGRVAARNISFALQQFGRMKVAGLRTREEAAGFLKTGDGDIFDTIGYLRGVTDDAGRRYDYIVYGEIYENDNYIKLDCKILDLERGYIIEEFSESAKGKRSINHAAMNTARRIYNTVPFKGRVLKIKEEGIIVNLGLIDGVEVGSVLVIFRNVKSSESGDIRRVKEIFNVMESDTYISYAEPVRKEVLREIDSTDTVYPLEKRRAKRLD
jgi:tetratricopeptide (TPR) repeat protein